jgi:Cdc6-like AAA superfamily ATPase
MHEAVAEHPRAHNRKLHQCTPVGEKAAALMAIADNYLLVLDEADDVHKTDLLDRLAEMDGVSYIAICHNPQEWIPSLSTPASRRLHTHIEFEAYSVAALTEILAQRATRGLVDDAVGTRTLEAIAERVDGVARLGIRTLFQAAQLAAEQHRDRIQREDIPPALSRARAAVRESNLRSLPIGHLLVYHIIQQADGELEAGAFHDRYDELAPQVFEGHPSYTPATQQTRRRYLEKLAEYDLVGWHGKKRGRTYFARDPELKIPQESGISVPSNIPQ